VSQRLLVAVAPAKLNFGLEILRRRVDGFHDLVTVLHAISLFDTFEWTRNDGAFAYGGPLNVAPDNDIALRALRLAPDFASWTGQLRLLKRIPAAAGMGGGSSDAALALRLAFPGASDAELRAAAASLGADVPFFVTGGAALATGTGAELRALPPIAAWVVVVTPLLKLADKTRELYGGLTSSDFSSGNSVAVVASMMRRREALTAPMTSAFERQMYARPVVRYAHTSLSRAGAPFVALSGAGPSLFALLRTYSDAARVAARLPDDVGVVTIARTLAGSHPQPARRIAQALRGRMTL
jgi:4-diphosphocytidyl-2-C-methyl-D-erythritol kinase